MATDARVRGSAFVLALLLSAPVGCASSSAAPVRPPPGLLFELTSTPMKTDFDDTPVGERHATKVIHFIQDPIFTGAPLFTWGNASIDAAANRAGIRRIHYVDYGALNVLGIYQQVRVQVSGDRDAPSRLESASAGP